MSLRPADLPIPGVLWGHYPERRGAARGWFARWVAERDDHTPRQDKFVRRVDDLQPVMQRFSIPATARASLAFYNTKQDLDAMADAIRKVKEVFD